MFVVKLVYQRASDTDDDEVVDRLNKCRDVNLQENHVDVDSGMFKLSTRIIISLPSYNVQHTLQRRPLLNTPRKKKATGNQKRKSITPRTDQIDQIDQIGQYMYKLIPHPPL